MILPESEREGRELHCTAEELCEGYDELAALEPLAPLVADVAADEDEDVLEGVASAEGEGPVARDAGLVLEEDVTGPADATPKLTDRP
jgi:hypothetical protein